MAEEKILSYTDAVKEQKCPACGAPMAFDPATGLMRCAFCGTTAEIEAPAPEPAPEPAPAPIPIPVPESAPEPESEPESEASPEAAQEGEEAEGKPGKKKQDKVEVKPSTTQGFDFASLNDQAVVEDAEALPIYNCVSCGAEIIAPPSQIALTCPYCSNNIVLTEKVSGKLRPNGVIPFKITAKELPAAMKSYYKDTVLLPRNFFSESTMGRVTGVYVPFWVFNGTASGPMSFTASTIEVEKVGNYELTTTNDYLLTRDVSLKFENVPVDASGKVDDKLMDSMEPFDMKELKPFDIRYLAGFTADRFDVRKRNIAGRARKRMLNSAASLAAAEITGYSGVKQQRADLTLDLDAKYLLFPIYLFDIAHAGKKYSFAVNGQTGKVVGNLPTDKYVSRIYFLKRFAIVAGGILAALILKYLLGR